MFAEGDQREFHAEVDLGPTLFYYEALGELVRWAGIIGREKDAAKISDARERLTEALKKTFSDLGDPATRERLGDPAIVRALRTPP